ncbi:phage baseplate protein [Oligella urethralis]|uniref:phage baseplate protein n=1 Tax=Oligella urethralis TaxID=90245 RepID=UPI00288B6305|nr:hypothetical protein [Oligella urethralis]
MIGSLGGIRNAITSALPNTSLVSILTRVSPSIAGYQFDAALEDTLEMSIDLTRYPVESGARVADHRIIHPIKYTLTGAISNNPLRVIDLSSLVFGGLSNLTNRSPYVASVAGMAASFLSGSPPTRASSTLEFLKELLVAGHPFDVDAVDIQLKDMVLTKITRERDPENENGLIFVAEMQELISIQRLKDSSQPEQEQLPDDDPAKAGAAATTSRGEQIGSTPSESTKDKIYALDGM